VEVPVLRDRLVVGLPSGTTRVEPSVGALYDLYEQRGAGGRLLVWTTGYPSVLPAQGAASVRDLYAAQYPSARVVADPSRPGRHRVEIDEPYFLSGSPWADLGRVLEVTDSGPHDPLWTVTVFVSRDLASADPAGCRAVAEALAATVRQVGGPRAVEPGPVCIDGVSGRTSARVTVPAGARWFLTPDRDLQGRPITVLELFPEVGGPALSFRVGLGSRPVATLRDGKPFRAALAGAEVEWIGRSYPELSLRGEEATRAVGPDVLWVVLRGRDQADTSRLRAALGDLSVVEAPCPPIAQ
jgi:hypothetical protein